MELATEDGVPMPPQAASAGLSLRVTPPGGGKSEAVTYSMAEGEGSAAQTKHGSYAFQLAELMQASQAVGW